MGDEVQTMFRKFNASEGRQRHGIDQITESRNRVSRMVGKEMFAEKDMAKKMLLHGSVSSRCGCVAGIRWILLPVSWWEFDSALTRDNG